MAGDSESTVQARRNSGLGIAAFVCSMSACVLTLGMVIYIGYLSLSHPDESISEANAFLVGVGALVFFVLALVGVGLGIGSIAQPDRRRVFGILGIAFGLLQLLSIVAMLLSGQGTGE